MKTGGHSVLNTYLTELGQQQKLDEVTLAIFLNYIDRDVIKIYIVQFGEEYQIYNDILMHLDE